MARQRKVIYIADRDTRIRAFWQAREERLASNNARIIRNPLAPAAVAALIDQIPRVKADLDAGDQAAKTA